MEVVLEAIGFVKMMDFLSGHMDVTRMNGASVLMIRVMQHLLMRHSVRGVGFELNTATSGHYAKKGSKVIEQNTFITSRPRFTRKE